MEQPKPWFRTAKNSWDVEIDGTQRFLGRHPDNTPLPQKSKKTRQWNPPPAILDAFHKLRSEGPQPCTDPAPPVASALTVAAVCDLFLDHSQKHNEPGTYAWYKSFLDDLCNHR